MLIFIKSKNKPHRCFKNSCPIAFHLSFERQLCASVILSLCRREDPLNAGGGGLNTLCKLSLIETLFAVFISYKNV